MKFAQLPTLYCRMLQSLQPWLCLPLATVKETPKKSLSVCTQTPALTFRVFVQSTGDSSLCAFPEVIHVQRSQASSILSTKLQERNIFSLLCPHLQWLRWLPSSFYYKSWLWIPSLTLSWTVFSHSLRADMISSFMLPSKQLLSMAPIQSQSLQVIWNEFLKKNI